MVSDFPGDVPPDFPHILEVPLQLDILPDGRETVVIGDPVGCKDFTHLQGDNQYGYQGTCGLVACEDILRQFGVSVTENDITRYAVENHLCNIADDPAQSGGTTLEWQAQILTDFGVPAEVKIDGSLEDLADYLEHGQGVIASVNAGILWNDAAYYDNGQPNHAIVVTGVSRDPHTGDIQGFYINDSGTGNSGEFVEAAQFQTGWLETGGLSVVTDAMRPAVDGPA